MTELEQLKSELQAEQEVIDSVNKRLNEIKDSIKQLENKEAKKQSVERWKPKSGELGYYISGSGDIDSAYFTYNESYEDGCVGFLNVFKTKEEAEKERNIQQVWKELRQFAKEWNACAGTHSYFIRYGISFKNSTLIDQELKDKFGDRLNLLDDL